MSIIFGSYYLNFFSRYFIIIKATKGCASGAFGEKTRKDMNREQVYAAMKQTGVVAVIRGDGFEKALATADACIAGGIGLIEVTFTVPGADRLIAELTKRYPSGAIIGAGSVLDPETARAAILAGAQFVFSPALSEETVRLCNRYAVAVVPGVFSPTEAVKALELGVRVVKLFPGDVAGPKGLKALKGPLPQLEIMPTGGVNLDNVGDWFKAGAFAVGAGSFLTKGANTGDYAAVEKTARELTAKIAAIKNGGRA